MTIRISMNDRLFIQMDPKSKQRDEEMSIQMFRKVDIESKTKKY